LSGIISARHVLFHRYTEGARRAIFFARYEASEFGTPEITSDELLLGIVREDKAIARQLGIDNLESIRREIESIRPSREKFSTSIDLPLAEECKRALAFGAEEADAMHQPTIEASHLVLGLLREEASLAAQLLRKRGVEYHRFRAIVQPAAPPVRLRPEELTAVEELQFFVDSTASQLTARTDAPGGLPLKGKAWTRKEALGHLIDWAMLHEQWFARALIETRLEVHTYPHEGAPAAHYNEYSWSGAVALWVSLNQLIVHVLAQIPKEKMELPIKIGNEEPVPLSKVVDAYIQHCGEVAEGILDD
jgi:hypothetical protein